EGLRNMMDGRPSEWKQELKKRVGEMKEEIENNTDEYSLQGISKLEDLKTQQESEEEKYARAGFFGKLGIEARDLLGAEEGENIAKKAVVRILWEPIKETVGAINKVALGSLGYVWALAKWPVIGGEAMKKTAADSWDSSKNFWKGVGRGISERWSWDPRSWFKSDV